MAKYAPGAISLPILLSDPVETPDAGKMFFYIVGGSVKYKTSDGNIFVLATGVSPEEVQDIIGSFISGTNGVSAVYNDASNTLVLSVNKAEIINDLGTGATDILSAQNVIQKISDAIAAHLLASDPHPQYATDTALTSGLAAKENTGVAASLLSAHEAASNPHPNYATDSDLTSGLATKENTGVAASLDAAHVAAADPHPQYTTSAELTSALTAKENTGVAAGLLSAHEAASNPHPNYATDSDLTSGLATKENTGVAASLDAAHVAAVDPHPQYATDTALTSGLATKENTITATTSADYYRGDKVFANFLNAVLAVVLTGYTVGANAAIAATDTILQAFGKIQGQINQINSILLAQILGDQFEEFSDLTTSTTTGATNIVAATFTTVSKPTGKYRIGINWLWANSSITVDGIFDVFLDGVLIETVRLELSEALNQRKLESLFFYSTFALVQTHVIELRMRQETAGSTLSCFTCRAEIWRVN
jgi:hypothetical protein